MGHLALTLSVALGAFAGLGASVGVSSVKHTHEQFLPSVKFPADALRQELRDDMLEDEAFVRMKQKDEEQAIRKRMKMEVQRLAWEGGRGSRLAASLDHNLLWHGDLTDTRPPPSSVASQSSVSQSTVLREQRDGSGHVRRLRKVKKCVNGICREYTESHVPKNSANRGSPKLMDKPTAGKPGKFRTREAPMDDEISRAVNEFRDLDDSLARAADFASPDIYDWHDHFSHRLRAPAPWSNDNANGPRAFESSRPMPDGQDPKAFQNSESVSSQTIIKNGRIVRESTRCKNGKCRSVMEEGYATPDSPPLNRKETMHSALQSEAE